MSKYWVKKEDDAAEEALGIVLGPDSDVSDLIQAACHVIDTECKPSQLRLRVSRSEEFLSNLEPLGQRGKTIFSLCKKATNTHRDSSSEAHQSNENIEPQTKEGASETEEKETEKVRNEKDIAVETKVPDEPSCDSVQEKTSTSQDLVADAHAAQLVVASLESAGQAVKSKQWVEAIKHFSSAIVTRGRMEASALIDRAPLSVLYTKRAECYLQQKQPSLALMDAELSLGFDSGSANTAAHFSKAAALQGLGKLEEAKDSALRALALGDKELAKDVLQCAEQVLEEVRRSLQQRNDFMNSPPPRLPGVPATLRLPSRQDILNQANGAGLNQLHILWAAHVPEPPWQYGEHSDFMRHCYVGNLKEVRILIDHCRGDTDNLHRLVNKQESILQLSPLMACIAALRLCPTTGVPKKGGKQWLPIVKLLLQHGADVNAQDIFGVSVVHHTTTYIPEGKTQEAAAEGVLPLLAEFSPNFDLCNKFGETPLSEAVKIRNVHRVRALLQFGAIPGPLARAELEKTSRMVNPMLDMFAKPTLAELIRLADKFRGLSKGTHVQLKHTEFSSVPGSAEEEGSDEDVDDEEQWQKDHDAAEKQGVIQECLYGKYRVAVSSDAQGGTMLINVPCECVSALPGRKKVEQKKVAPYTGPVLELSSMNAKKLKKELKDRGVADTSDCNTSEDLREKLAHLRCEQDVVVVGNVAEKEGKEKDCSEAACAQCGEAGASQACSMCMAVRYCDSYCQKAHWAQHRKNSPACKR